MAREKCIEARQHLSRWFPSYWKSDANVHSQVQKFSVRSVVVSGTAVTVTVQARPRTAFGYLMPISTPIVVSAAKAINKVR